MLLARILKQCCFLFNHKISKPSRIKFQKRSLYTVRSNSWPLGKSGSKPIKLKLKTKLLIKVHIQAPYKLSHYFDLKEFPSHVSFLMTRILNPRGQGSREGFVYCSIMQRVDETVSLNHKDHPALHPKPKLKNELLIESDVQPPCRLSDYFVRKEF